MFIQRIGAGGVIAHRVQVTHLEAAAGALEVARFFAQPVVVVIFLAALIVRHAVAMRVDKISASGAVAGKKLPLAAVVAVVPLQPQRLVHRYTQFIAADNEVLRRFVKRKTGQAEAVETVARAAFPRRVIGRCNAPRAVKRILTAAFHRHAEQARLQYPQAERMGIIDGQFDVVVVGVGESPVFEGFHQHLPMKRACCGARQ